MDELLKQRLEHVMNTKPHSVECMVAHEALAFKEGPTAFFLEILTTGCPCGLESLLNDRISTPDFNAIERETLDMELGYRGNDMALVVEEDSVIPLSSEEFERVARKMYFQLAFEPTSNSDCFSPVTL